MHPGFTYVYAQPTASVGPTDYIPVTGDPDFMDAYTQLDDKGNRRQHGGALRSEPGRRPLRVLDRW